MSTPPLRLRPPGCWSLEYARQRLKLAATHRSEWDRLVNALDPDDARAIVDGTQEWFDMLKKTPEEEDLLWRPAVHLLSLIVAKHGLWQPSIMNDVQDFPRVWTGYGAERGVASVSMCQLPDIRRAAWRWVHFHRTREAFIRQMLVWKQLQHRHILPLLGLVKDPRYSCVYFMITPWMPKTLAEYVTPGQDLSAPTTPGGYSPAQDRGRLMKELALAIAYLHARKIVHGDVKDSNILIDQHNHVQLADLGLSPVSHNPTDDDDSSVLWEAPEVQTSLAVRGDLPRDVYAYALVCCMMITGTPPFEGKSKISYWRDVIDHGERPVRPTSHVSLGRLPPSADLWSMIERCWVHHPQERLTMKHVMACLGFDKATIDTIYQPQSDPHFSFKASRDYNVEDDCDLSFQRGDTIEVVNGCDQRWFVRDARGMLGYITPHADDVARCTLFRVQARDDYIALLTESNKPKVLSLTRGEQLEVLDVRNSWWMARNTRGDVGVVPAVLVKPLLRVSAQSIQRSRALINYAPPEDAIHHISLNRNETVKLLCNAGAYFIAERRGRTGIVPSHFIAPISVS